MPVLADNKEARFHYDFQEHYEAGIALIGAEVKSCKNKRLNLKGSYVSYDKGQLWLKQMQISPYQPKNQLNYDPKRERLLLMQRKEIDSLMGKLKAEGLTLIPEKVYTKGGLIKVSLALARGRKAHDKRALLKKRDVTRDIQRALRQKV